jgi:hypothetical protein
VGEDEQAEPDEGALASVLLHTEEVKDKPAGTAIEECSAGAVTEVCTDSDEVGKLSSDEGKAEESSFGMLYGPAAYHSKNKVGKIGTISTHYNQFLQTISPTGLINEERE